MLCSHTKRFIYLKTMKTAGTSTEIFFEKYCCPPSLYAESHARPELVTEVGIIGYRGLNPGNLMKFDPHMPADKLRNLLGEEIWNSYFKFCVIRNPFDKVVSMFWMQMSELESMELAAAPFPEIKDRFALFCENEHLLPIDYPVYKIGKSVAVDFFIRFENLVDDVKKVCHRLHIPFVELGRFKAQHRKRPEHFSLYYQDKSEEIVRANYSWEIEHFGYHLTNATRQE